MVSNISLIQAPAVGNALRVFLAPPPGASSWRLLRRTADEFAGPDDPGAVVVVDQSRDDVVLDTTALVNGTSYVYRLYSSGPAGWTMSDPATGTPAAIYQPGGPNPQQIVRDRIDLGMAVETAAGRLKPEGGRVYVITAPFVLADNAKFPTVTVHMDSAEPAERALGEMLSGDFEMPGGIGETEGWLERWSMTVLAVSLNPDERITLREALRRVVLANLSVFDDAGMVQIAFAQRDVEDTQSYTTPLYMSYGTFTCLTPTFVSDVAPRIVDVDVQPIVVDPHPRRDSVHLGPSLLGFQPYHHPLQEHP